MSKVYHFYCEICNWKKIYNDNVDLVEFKKSPVQKRLPWLEDGKLKKASQKALPKSYKCPNCGRLVKPKISGEDDGQKSRFNGN